MKALSLEEMTNFSGGLTDEAGISCILNARVEYGDYRYSYWTCDNGTTMSYFSQLGDDGIWYPIEF